MQGPSSSGLDEDPNSAVTAAVPEGIDGKQLVRMVFREHGYRSPAAG